MHVIEIVAIGDEVLSGSILNTNAAFISRSLQENGYYPSRHMVLPDDADSLQRGLEEACARAACVICTGGLGPTCDDNTRQTAARIFGSDWRYDEEVAQSLRLRYGDRLISLRDQATVPAKALVIPNFVGTAPGLLFENLSGGLLILLPGVPGEMREMFTKSVLPFLLKKIPVGHPIIQKNINLVDVTESAIDPLLRELAQLFPSMKIGIYANEGILRVLLAGEKSAEESLLSAYDRIVQKYVRNIFESAAGKVEEALQALFLKKGWTLSVAESCTGGSIAAKITRLPGASRYFLGGAVVYSNELKHKLLGVPMILLEEKGAVSLPVVEQMVIGMRRVAGTDYAIAVSGIAGPDGGTEEMPVGTICAAISGAGILYAWQFRVYGSREMVIAKSVNLILAKLLTQLTDGSGNG